MLLGIKNYTSAFAALQKAVAIDPIDAGANCLLGTAFKTHGHSVPQQRVSREGLSMHLILG